MPNVLLGPMPLVCCWSLGLTLNSASGRRKFRKNSRKTPETLSELFLEFPSRVRLGSPKPYNSRHLKAPEYFHPPPSTAGDASFFRSGSGEGLSEPVMEFPAVLQKNPHTWCGGFSRFNVLSSFSSLPFLALVFHLSLCFLTFEA